MAINPQQVQDKLNALLQQHEVEPELSAERMERTGVKLRNSETCTSQVPLFTPRGHEVAMGFMQQLWAKRAKLR